MTPPQRLACTAAGVRELKVNDCSGGVGAIDLTFPEREVTVTPEGGRVGSEMVVSGRNFPVFNNGGSEVEIAVMYEAAGRERDRETVEPDEAGNFIVALDVPEDAPSRPTTPAGLSSRMIMDF